MIKKRVLIIDDEEAVVRILKLGLERTRRYLVRTESDSTKALASARGFQPDIILMDIMMPEIDGGELAALVRKEPALRAVPIIFMTALLTTTDQHRLPAGEGPVFIPKPVKMTYLLSLLEKQLADPAGV